MPSSKELQNPVVKGLHADVQAVDTRSFQVPKIVLRNVSRVDFHGDFNIFRIPALVPFRVFAGMTKRVVASRVIKTEMMPGGREKIVKLLCGEQGRGSAAEIDRVKTFKGNKRWLVESHFPHDGLYKIRDQIRRNNGVKAAISAFAQAKRNMNVKPGLLILNHCPTSAPPEMRSAECSPSRSSSCASFRLFAFPTASFCG